MSSIIPLWLPIVAASVGVFIASSILHMVIRWHNTDYKQLSNEAALNDALRGATPGEYRTPWANSMEEMHKPDFQEKVKRGPVAIIGVFAPSLDFGFKKALALWFVYTLVVSWLSSHIAHAVLHDQTPSFYIVFHTVGIAAWLAYGLGQAHQSIWGPKPWLVTVKNLVDGLVYAAVTGAIFAWLWPRM